MLSLRPLRSHAPRQRSAYARPPYSPHFASFRFNSTRTAHPQSNGPVTQSEVPKVKLAIVGGGLGGLSSAFYFLRNLSPRLREGVEVVIFEKDHKRTGGWCRSVRVDSEGKETGTKSVEAGGATGEEKEVVFETGPRSIRPVGLSGWLTVEMVSLSFPLFLRFDAETRLCCRRTRLDSIRRRQHLSSSRFPSRRPPPRTATSSIPINSLSSLRPSSAPCTPSCSHLYSVRLFRESSASRSAGGTKLIWLSNILPQRRRRRRPQRDRKQRTSRSTRSSADDLANRWRRI